LAYRFGLSLHYIWFGSIWFCLFGFDYLILLIWFGLFGLALLGLALFRLVYLILLIFCLFGLAPFGLALFGLAYLVWLFSLAYLVWLYLVWIHFMHSLCSQSRPVQPGWQEQTPAGPQSPWPLQAASQHSLAGSSHSAPFQPAWQWQDPPP
jgi:hypothetical protein